MDIRFSKRQEKIIEIVKKNQTITGEDIANKLNLTRSTLRPDLSLLTMIGILDARPRVGYFYTGKTKFSSASDEIKNIIVDDVKAMPIIIEESTSVYDAIVFMFLENVDALYVTNKGVLVGVVSRKDIIKIAIGETDLYKVPVGMIMTRMANIIFIESQDNILNAAKKLIQYEINSLPVVEKIEGSNSQYRVLGRITKTTITRLFLEIGNND